jgi:hypothetical protein
MAFCCHVKIVWYNPPYNFKDLTGETETNLETPRGLVLESDTELTVRASAITTTRKIRRYRAFLGARFSKIKIQGLYLLAL